MFNAHLANGMDLMASVVSFDVPYNVTGTTSTNRRLSRDDDNSENSRGFLLDRAAVEAHMATLLADGGESAGGEAAGAGPGADGAGGEAAARAFAKSRVLAAIANNGTAPAPGADTTLDDYVSGRDEGKVYYRVRKNVTRLSTYYIIN